MVLTKIYFQRIVLNRTKISLFESITDRKTGVSRDGQNVCAVTIVGIKGNNMKTVLRKGCLRKKLVNRFICPENA